MNRNYQEGKKENGKYYLSVGNTWVEIEERVYFGYMQLVWKEHKNEERRARCIVGGVRCQRDCEECEHEKTGGFISLDQLFEETDFEPADPGPSVEERVLKRFLIEALHRELKELPLEDRIILHDIYFEEIPYTQSQIARRLHISQQRVSERHRELLIELRVKLENDICE